MPNLRATPAMLPTPNSCSSTTSTHEVASHLHYVAAVAVSLLKGEGVAACSTSPSSQSSGGRTGEGAPSACAFPSSQLRSKPRTAVCRATEMHAPLTALSRPASSRPERWLADHASFGFCMAAAPHQCGTDPVRACPMSVRQSTSCVGRLPNVLGALRPAPCTPWCNSNWTLRISGHRNWRVPGLAMPPRGVGLDRPRGSCQRS
jgi:hypothetical protein